MERSFLSRAEDWELEDDVTTEHKGLDMSTLACPLRDTFFFAQYTNNTKTPPPSFLVFSSHPLPLQSLCELFRAA